MNWLDAVKESAVGHYNYWLAIALMMIGFYIVIIRGNLIKKIVGLNIFQTAVIMFYVSMGKVDNGTAPILFDTTTAANPDSYTNPLPSVLMLTAIVVGIATTALGLALVVRIKEAYGTIEEEEILAADAEAEAEEDAYYAAQSLLAEQNAAAHSDDHHGSKGGHA
jgi:multicomponent Na+:H+ antiporter subunit C